MPPALPQKINGFRATVINALIDYVESLQPIRTASVLHRWTSKGVAYEIARRDESLSEDPSQWAFGCTLSGDTLTVQTGTFYVQGLVGGEYELAGTDYSLPASPSDGNYCYPTVRFELESKTLSLVLGTDKPDMVANEVLVPLVRLKATGSPASWDFDGDNHILKRGDIQFSTALVFG